MISTDDAYVQADMAFVSPKITGYVASRRVVENQHVKAGDPLVTIDDGDYSIALAQAEAQIDVQKQDARPHPRADRCGACRTCGRPRRRRRPRSLGRQCRARRRSRHAAAEDQGRRRRRRSTTPRPRSTRPRRRSPAPTRRSPAPRPISAFWRRSMQEAQSTLRTSRARPRQGGARPLLHRAARAL